MISLKSIKMNVVFASSVINLVSLKSTFINICWRTAKFKSSSASSVASKQKKQSLSKIIDAIRCIWVKLERARITISLRVESPTLVA